MSLVTPTAYQGNAGQVASIYNTAGPVGENLFSTVRATKYGEQFVQGLWHKSHVFADEESYFVVSNATIGTPITLGGATQTGWVATTPTIVIYNGSGTNKIYMDFIKLQMVGAGTALTEFRWASMIDTGNRYTSGGTGITGINPPKMRDTVASKISSSATVTVGAITAPAANNSRLLGQGLFRTAIPVASDQYTLIFGGVENSTSAANTGGTNAICQSYYTVPAIIAPGCSFLLYTWGASMSASPTAEVTIGWVER